jgi:predicted DNA-binding protein with PD1-like motif
LSFRISRYGKARHLVLRASQGERLPDALHEALLGEGVTHGWLRGSGVLEEVELRAFDPSLGAFGGVRSITGPLQVLSIEGSITLGGGTPSCKLQAVLARETDHGLETLSGEIGRARALSLEILVTALEDVTAARPAARSADSLPTPSEWNSALEASAETVHERPSRPRPSALASPSQGAAQAAGPSALIPPRRLRPGLDLDAPAPEAGDLVDHFAFGRCDVLKSDGERLHLKVHKDGRIREIALEMLRVTPLEEGEEGSDKRRFKLERKL